MFGNYAFRIKMNKGNLALGLLGGFAAYQENLSEVQTNDNDDSEFLNNTPAVFAPNFGFGTYYYTIIVARPGYHENIVYKGEVTLIR